MNDYLINIVSIQISACIAETLTYPIDYIKTLIQYNKKNTYLNTIYNQNKLTIYRGLKPALLRHCLYTSLRINIYDHLKKNSNEHILNKFLIGAVSGATAQIIANPLDLLKVRYITDPKLNKSMFQTTFDIIKTNGVLGLWKGSLPNIARGTLVNFGELATYDYSKKHIKNLTNLKDDTPLHFLSSVCSGFSAAIFCTPADVIKTRLMQQNSNHTSVLECIKFIYKNEGLMSFYRGFIPIWIRLAPWQIIFWTSYEKLRKINGMECF